MGKTVKTGRFQRKVRIFEDRYSESLEKGLNNFLVSHDAEHVVDIKLTEVKEGFTAMVIYDEFVPDDGEI